MRKVKGVIVSVLTVILSVNHAELSTCETDCGNQAGVPCEIIINHQDCPRKPPSSGSEYPGLPENVILKHYMKDTIPQLNVTWTPPSTGVELVKAFEIKYWNYVDNPDPDATRGPEGDFGFCVQYNMTRGIYPESHAHFHHDCVSPTQHYITVASLPQKEPDHDYVHRVAAMYKQDAEHSALWQPPLVVIHNNSCQHVVEVELVLAPESLRFKHYKVALKYPDDLLNDSDSEDIFVEPGTETASVRFTDVQNDIYVIKVYPEPEDVGYLCKCPDCGNRCWSTKTGAFWINDTHPKCSSLSDPDVSPSELPDSPLFQNSSVLVALSILCVFFIMVLAAILVLVYKRKPKKDKVDDEQLGSIHSFPYSHSIAGPMDDRVFEDYTSGHMKVENEKQSQMYGDHLSIRYNGRTLNTPGKSHAVPMTSEKSVDPDLKSSGELEIPATVHAPQEHPANHGDIAKAAEEKDTSSLEDEDSHNNTFPFEPPVSLESMHRGESLLGSEQNLEYHKFGIGLRRNSSPDSDTETNHGMPIEGTSDDHIKYVDVSRQIPTGKKWRTEIDIIAENEHAV